MIENTTAVGASSRQQLAPFGCDRFAPATRAAGQKPYCDGLTEALVKYR
jgi:hypothetical protein